VIARQRMEVSPRRLCAHGEVENER
jgi:hypothetical protein